MRWVLTAFRQGPQPAAQSIVGKRLMTAVGEEIRRTDMTSLPNPTAAGNAALLIGEAPWSPGPADSVPLNANGLASQLPGSMGRASRPLTTKLLYCPPARAAHR